MNSFAGTPQIPVCSKHYPHIIHDGSISALNDAGAIHRGGFATAGFATAGFATAGFATAGFATAGFANGAEKGGVAAFLLEKEGLSLRDAPAGAVLIGHAIGRYRVGSNAGRRIAEQG